MKQNLSKALGLKDWLLVNLGRLLTKMLNIIKYSNHLQPKKNEILNLFSRGYEVNSHNNLLIVKKENIPFSFTIRPLSSDGTVLSQIWEHQEYIHLIEIIKKYNYIDRVSVIVDAGANIGLTSFFFNHFFPTAKIIAIEPDKENYRMLVKNMELNDIFNNTILTFNNALWINNSDQLIISNSFRDGNHWSKTVEISKQQEDYVIPITLKEIINMDGIDHKIDILKIDIEGSETYLFQNESFIENLATSIKFLSLEIHDEFDSREKIHRILKEKSFIVQDIGETTFCANTNLLEIS
ncbi:FkbM family methyltransferase [Pedobacter agri]|uniref:FkbM family methyltransferase n=1 Tax=Pedobacter agri TaxID=454586 RepID=A0A9X3DAE0_9SPHI|nr:FkbM family methyltransferase [Pedobacter agri]MCX3263634.1 FkbM family methyltransferase [Pedobacter agri]